MPSLFVLTAAEADRAVILRRGPSRWFHVIGWDTRRDVFEHGAWIKGRIYESACDLSPDGRLLVAGVRQSAQSGTSYTHAWTAVSRAPWLQALALWPQGTIYGLGGRFDGPRSLILRGGWYDGMSPHPDHRPDALVWRKANEPQNEAPRHTAGDLIAGADWSGRDCRGGVIFARGGRLFRLEKSEERQIADFTDLTPDPQPAPEWAGRPL